MRPPTPPACRRARALLATAALVLSAASYANPTGPVVVSGSATVIPAGNILQITNAPNTIINWQSFSIHSGEITRFTQQSAASAVLNRVTTQNPTAILGALESNGRVFLVNPNGILFATGSRVDVAGLVASTLNMTDADFLAGRLRFEGGNGIMVQGGTITTPAGGSVYLIGGNVINLGAITAPNGEVVLAAGQTVELFDPGTPNLRVEIAATDQRVVNLGQITAQAGRVGIFAGLIDQGGTVNANTAVATDDGRIVLRANGDIRFVPGSTTSATGPGTGNIQIQSLTGDVATTGADISADPATGSISVTGVSGAQAGAAPSSAQFLAPTPVPQEALPFTTATTAQFDGGLTTSASGASTLAASPGFLANTTFTTTPQSTATAPTLSSVPTLMTGVPTLTISTPTLTTATPTLTTGVPTSGLSPLNTGTTFTTAGQTGTLGTAPAFTTVPFGTVPRESTLAR